LDERYGLTFSFIGYWGWITILFASFFFADTDAELAPLWRARVHVANAVLFLSLLVFSWAFIWRQQLLVNNAPAWIVLAALFCVATLPRLDSPAAAIVALMFALSLRHNRSIADAVTATLPILTRNCTQGLDRLARWRMRRYPRVRGALRPYPI